jgi:ADP-ribosylation factor related protein 1
LLLLANKQDTPTSLSVSEIRESFDAWTRTKPSSKVDDPKGKGKAKETSDEDQTFDDGGARDERMASLDVLGVSALEG